jgi:osmotically-inducible protein OsmY
MTERGKSLSAIQKKDEAIKESVYEALWKDDVLRAIEYSEIDVDVKDRVVHLNGHIVSTTSQSRIRHAIRGIPGIFGIEDNLVPDDKLTVEVAASLGNLEHTYGCKFFTGVSHGVVSLNGTVSDVNVKLMAEKCAAANQSVRAVVNNVRIAGVKPELREQVCLQPAIGEPISFLDGISGVVKQVIINPNNRRVIAMTLQGEFSDQGYESTSLAAGQARRPDQIVVVPMDAVRYLTRASGFLSIRSSERNRYRVFTLDSFIVPDQAWIPPYPYCPADVLFPVEYQDAHLVIADGPLAFPIAVLPEDTSLSEQLLANDSLGG